jgi:hypothetical protein
MASNQSRFMVLLWLPSIPSPSCEPSLFSSLVAGGALFWVGDGARPDLDPETYGSL